MQILLSTQQLHVTIKRLAHQLIENYSSLENIVFIGIQPRGIRISELVVQQVKLLCPQEVVQQGLLDITFYRDDVRYELHKGTKTDIPFSIEGKKVAVTGAGGSG